MPNINQIRDSIDIPYSFVLSTGPNKTDILDYNAKELHHNIYNNIRNISSKQALSEYYNKNTSTVTTDAVGAIYELNSAVIHQGMINSGHYYSLCRKYKDTYKSSDDNKTVNSNWMKLNDHLISEINEVDAMKEMKGLSINELKGSSTNAYILFYEKIK